MDTELRKPQNRPDAYNHPVTNQIAELNLVETGAERPNIIAWSSGLDWLSLTTPNDDLGAAFFKAFRRHSETAPLAKSPYVMNSFKGETAAGFSWAWSEYQKLYFFQASGEGAKEAAKMVALTARPAQITVTRVDVRLDIELDKRDTTPAKRVFEHFSTSKSPSFSLIAGSGNRGDTVYIGSRSSSQFARIYDKGAEQGLVSGWKWRMEIVFRKPFAQDIWERYYDRLLGSAETSTLSRNIVLSWLEQRGISVSLPGMSVELPQMHRPKSDVEKRLEWLQRQVKPTVEKLINAGYGDEVRKRLGIDLDSP